MPKYLCRSSYTPDGLKGLLKEGGTACAEAVRKAVEGMGGVLEAVYFAFGETDVYLIMEMPDNATAAASSIMGNVGGTTPSTWTVLMTPEEVDRAVEIANARMKVFRRPGE